jgi:excisionase family DNA binding protein
MQACFDVYPEGGSFSSRWAFSGQLKGSAAIGHGGGVGHAVTDEGLGNAAMMGQGCSRLSGDAGVGLGLVEHEKEGNRAGFEECDRGGGRPKIGRAWTYRHQYQIGQAEEGGVFVRAGRRGIDDAISGAALFEHGKASGKVSERHFDALRALGLAVFMPSAERALWVGIDEIDGAVARAFGLHGQMSGKRGFTRAAFLGIDDDGFHANMLRANHANMVACKHATFSAKIKLAQGREARSSLSHNSLIAFNALTARSYVPRGTPLEMTMTTLEKARQVDSPPMSAAEIEMARVAQRCIMEGLDHSRAAKITLTTDQGKHPSVELPPQALKLIGQLLGLMSEGRAFTLIPTNQELSTVEAAHFLNVSRPFVIKEIEEGRLPHRKVGTHRRVMFEDLRTYALAMRARQASALERMAENAAELGLRY